MVTQRRYKIVARVPGIRRMGRYRTTPDCQLPSRLPSADCQAVRELAGGSWGLGWEMAVGSWDGRWHRERAAARLGEYDLGKSGWSYGVGSWDGRLHQYSSRLPTADCRPNCHLPSADCRAGCRVRRRRTVAASLVSRPPAPGPRHPRPFISSYLPLQGSS
jgi:hypothetical protein